MHAHHRSRQAPPRPAARRSGVLSTLLLAVLVPLTQTSARAAGTFALASCTTCAQRGSAAVAGNPQGAFLAGWTGATESASKAVLARFFQPNGAPRAAETVLSSVAPFANGDVAVAAERSGFFAAAWSRRDGLDSSIVVQRYRRTTATLGAPITVSLDAPGTIQLDFAPAVAFLSDGSFVVVWERYGPPFEGSAGSPVEVMARRFSFRTGVAYGPPQRVNAGLVEAGRPAVCANTAGTVAVAWTSVDRVVPFLPSLHGVTFRRLTPNGQPLGGEVVLAAPAASVSGLALSCSRTTFTAAWRTDQAPASGEGVVARRVSNAGAVTGEAFAVSDAGAEHVSTPAIVDDAAGNTTAAWVAADAQGARLVTRRIAAGGALGSASSVAFLGHANGLLTAPAIGGIGRAGDFVLVWTGDEGLRGRRFSAAGVPLGARALAADLAAEGVDAER